MRPLIQSVQKLSLTAKRSSNQIDFLNSTVTDIDCQSMVKKMMAISPQ